MGNNCTLLFADLFQYAYKAGLLDGFLKHYLTFNFTFLYKNFRFGDSLPHIRFSSKLRILQILSSPQLILNFTLKLTENED